MARSRRKSPFIGIAGTSDKHFKQKEHRKHRKAVKAALAAAKELPDPKLFGDPWDSPKDGKTQVDPGSKWMRK